MTSTKNIRAHRGTPYQSRHARAEDGHRGALEPAPKVQPSNVETAEAAQMRRNREGGIK